MKTFKDHNSQNNFLPNFICQNLFFLRSSLSEIKLRLQKFTSWITFLILSADCDLHTPVVIDKVQNKTFFKTI